MITDVERFLAEMKKIRDASKVVPSVFVTRNEHDAMFTSNHHMLMRLFSCGHFWSLRGIEFYDVPVDLSESVSKLLAHIR